MRKGNYMGRNYKTERMAYGEDPLGAYIQGCIDRGNEMHRPNDAWETMSAWERDEYYRALSGRSMSRELRSYHQYLLMKEKD